jgi:peroxiredoxin-like protein
MHPLPHDYDVTVRANETGTVEITSRGLDVLISAPPREFDGPGNRWSPETLLVAAVADCLVLTFRSIANVAKLRWTSLVCDANGVLDRADGVIRFTAIRLHARLSLPAGTDVDKANKILQKAKNACLVGNSLKCAPTLETAVTVEKPAAA